MKTSLFTTACALSIASLFLLTSGCTGGRTERAYRVATGGTSESGRKIIESKKCGACHTIPGIRTARGRVAPPLYFFSQRSFVAGEVPNTVENLVKWVKAPQSIEPGTAMPNLGLSDQEARDVAAYLYTLD